MKYFVESYGCTMNHGEGFELGERMRLMGHEPVASADEAEIIILNTCTVVETTEKKMLRRISEIRKDGKEIIISGCMAKAQRSRITIHAPGSIVISPEEYGIFPDAVSVRYGSSEPFMPCGSTVSGILPIAQGCLGNCTYCITKIARGELGSYSPDGLVRRFNEMIDHGAKEILLTAQDTGCYGRDIGTDLPSLLREMLKTEGEYRIRIGMMNPNHLMAMADDLLDVMEDPRVYRFLHIPVQSGSDAVLKGMNRFYSVHEFRELIQRTRSRYPDIGISTDIIAGFPLETEDDHRGSMDLVRWLNADTVNITRFSSRPGTKAFGMIGKVHGRVSKERSRELTELTSERKLIGRKEQIGNTYRVLVTEYGKEGTVMARTPQYGLVVIGEDLDIGTFADVEITDARPDYLFGRLLNK